jgi:hypothetical protein
MLLHEITHRHAQLIQSGRVLEATECNPIPAPYQMKTISVVSASIAN